MNFCLVMSLPKRMLMILFEMLDNRVTDCLGQLVCLFTGSLSSDGNLGIADVFGLP